MFPPLQSIKVYMQDADFTVSAKPLLPWAGMVSPLQLADWRLGQFT